MKITNNLLEVLNAGKDDLLFELGVLSTLEELENEGKLEEYLTMEFEKEEELDADGEPTGDFEASFEERQRNHFKHALSLLGVSNRSELLAMLSKRHNRQFDTFNDVNKFVENLIEDFTIIAQVDRVVDGLVRFGLSDSTKQELEAIRDREVTKLCDTLLLKKEN